MPLESLSRPLSYGLVSELLLTIEVPEIDSNSEELRIENFRYIGSYNWAEGSDEANPVIMVPGELNEVVLDSELIPLWI
jgi:hypothetical protein